MTNSFRKILRGIGVPRANIKTDFFQDSRNGVGKNARVFGVKRDDPLSKEAQKFFAALDLPGLF